MRNGTWCKDAQGFVIDTSFRKRALFRNKKGRPVSVCGLQRTGAQRSGTRNMAKIVGVAEWPFGASKGAGKPVGKHCRRVEATDALAVV